MAVESKPLLHPEVIIEPARTLAAEAMKLEREINDLVNQAYCLTPEEIDLMWTTAPPRMPISKPNRTIPAQLSK